MGKPLMVDRFLNSLSVDFLSGRSWNQRVKAPLVILMLACWYHMPGVLSSAAQLMSRPTETDDIQRSLFRLLQLRMRTKTLHLLKD
jgi:hypothetical protein